MSLTHRFIKRTFDIALAASGLLALWPLILAAILLARIDTKASGLFRQRRIGRFGKPFILSKVRTMRAIEGTSVTTANDARITRLGRFFRRWKIDELPQLWNVLTGDMSFVGPRPDVEGFADRLKGEDRVVLSLRPGITGPATLKYRDEERLLARQPDPESYNREVIWPDKIRINRAYLEEYSLGCDLRCIIRTVTGR